MLKFKGLAPTLYRNIGFANCIAFSCFNMHHKTSIEKFYSEEFLILDKQKD